MATITVEGIPDALVARLAIVAAGNGRCLNSEVIVRLARSAGGPPELRGSASAAPVAHAGGCGGKSRCRCGRSSPPEALVEGWGGPAAGRQLRGVLV